MSRIAQFSWVTRSRISARWLENVASRFTIEDSDISVSGRPGEDADKPMAPETDFSDIREYEGQGGLDGQAKAAAGLDLFLASSITPLGGW